MPRRRRLFLIGMGLLYGAFLVCDFWVPGSRMLSAVLKYSSVWLCFGFVLAGRREAGRPAGSACVSVAQGFTLVADYFLLFTTHFLPGVLVFCGAQLAYLWRYWPRGFWRVGLPLAGGAGLLLVVAGVAHIALPAALLAMAVYGVLLLLATLAAWRAPLPRPNALLARWGMVLFVLCDVNVLLFNVLPPQGLLYSIAAPLMWVFYLPSQLCIALSTEDYAPLHHGGGAASG